MNIAADDIPGMAGLVLSNAKHLSLEVEKLQKIIPDVMQRTLHVFAQAGGITMYPPEGRIIGSLYYPDVPAAFDRLIVGANNRVFHGPWGHAFYYQLNRMLSAKGQLILPVNPSGEAWGYWSVAQLRKLFGSEGRVLGSGEYIQFPRSATMPRSDSLLSWYFDNYASVLTGDMVSRMVGNSVNVQRLDDLFLELALDNADTIIAAPRRWAEQGNGFADASWFKSAEATARNPARTIGSELSASLHVVSYLMSGLSYKAAAMRFIIRNHCKAAGPLSHIDFGGAYGQLVMELLLDPDLRVEKGVCCDINSVYLSGAYRIYRGLRKKLYGRFLISNQKMQDFTFDRKYSIISVFSTFLYVPKEAQLPTLQKCWDNLERGGVLVVFEVLKANPKYKDYAKQFTASEIDALLGRFGEVGRIGATGNRMCSASDAKERMVIRFVVKS